MYSKYFFRDIQDRWRDRKIDTQMEIQICRQTYQSTDKQINRQDKQIIQTDIQLTLNRSTNVTLGEITRLPEKSERASPGKITS